MSSPFPSRAAVLAGVALGLCLLAECPASAASVTANTDATPAPTPPAGGKVLERALTGDVTSGSKNVDMLLEMRRNEAAEVGRPMPEPSARSSVQLPAVQTGVAPPERVVAPGLDPALAPVPALVKQGLAEVDEALGLPKGATVQTVREWGGSGGGSSSRGPVGPAMDVTAPAPPSELSPLMRLPAQIIQAVRDYRYWLLGAAALALALAAAYKKFNRRI